MTTVLTPLPGSTILFEGDSLTGFRLRDPVDSWPWIRLTNAMTGYPERVGDWLFCNRPDLKITCRLGAIGGSFMSDLLNRWNQVELLKPAIVVMTIGSNDSTVGIDLEVFRGQIADYCARLSSLCGGRVMFLGNPTCSSASEESGTSRKKASEHYRVAAEEVMKTGGLALDIGAVLDAKQKELTEMAAIHTVFHDGGHFNAVGHEIIAGIVLRGLGLMEMPGDPHPLVRYP